MGSHVRCLGSSQHSILCTDWARGSSNLLNTLPGLRSWCWCRRSTQPAEDWFWRLSWVVQLLWTDNLPNHMLLNAGIPPLASLTNLLITFESLIEVFDWFSMLKIFPRRSMRWKILVKACPMETDWVLHVQLASETVSPDSPGTLTEMLALRYLRPPS